MDRLQQVLQGSASVSTLAGQIEQLQQDIDDGAISPEQAVQLSLVTAAATVVGSVSERLARLQEASENAAKALITEIVRGREDGATIRVEQAVRETETLSLAQQITTLTADMLNTTALVEQEQIARASADEALAADLTTVSTALDGNVTTVTQIQESVDGIAGRWGVAINANGQVTGLVQLSGEVTGSTFTVVADKFLVAGTGAERVVPFAIDTTTSPPTIVLDGNIIAPRSILAGSIAAGAITANEIAAGSITSVEIDTETLTVKRVLSANGKLDINALGDTPYIRMTT